MDFATALSISAAGMDVQTSRLRVIAENLANQSTTGETPGSDPYRRKVVSFANEVDQAAGVPLVSVKAVGTDPSEFPLKYDPSHPAANAAGFVKMPNVNSFVEVMDMREAERAYAANLNVLQVTKSMLTRTIEMLK